MIKYDSKISSTNSTIVNMFLSILLLSSTIGSNHIKRSDEYLFNKHNISSNQYSFKSIDETFSINDKYKKMNYDENEILKKLNVFLSNLAQEQESLGNEFAKVLFDNIFDLYQS